VSLSTQPLLLFRGLVGLVEFRLFNLGTYYAQRFFQISSGVFTVSTLESHRVDLDFPCCSNHDFN
jgi:hypothetical protein